MNILPSEICICMHYFSTIQFKANCFYFLLLFWNYLENQLVECAVKGKTRKQALIIQNVLVFQTELD